MLPLLLLGIVFFFLLLGSAVFLASVLIAPTRRYALSAALWCAIWGPSSSALMLLAGAGLVAAAFITKNGDLETFHSPRLLAAFGWSYLVVGVLITLVVATVSSLIHQAVISRMTFSLFRLYAAIVSSGIGSVFSCCLGWWMMQGELSGYVWLFVWAVCALALVAGFGVAAYKGAKSLRGDAPKRFTWVSSAEYAGN